ncbi:MAG: heparan-alpha-glucosaminide N-acetyltransferase domain-containing protein [Bacteroidales bacterium]|nr:heparan-alpha-glucosaminide N-acetyltransferase domain-containing protein [Bacteroidales bacterium]HOI33038.1 heparan-alpha-glucosaminide N-acetyltransferase domain-containing protein [Bacteroidales bacterium]
MTNTLKSRLLLPDLLKGIAVVMMVQVHLTELFALPAFYESTVGSLSLFMGGPPAAPVFMVVMGYFVARKAAPPLSLLMRGSKLIMLGLLLNIGLNFNLLIRFSQGKIIGIDPWTYVFGVDILFLAGISLMVFAGLKVLFKKKLIFWLTTLFITILASSQLSLFVSENRLVLFIQSFFSGITSWSYFPFFPWFSYPLAGYFFYLLSKKYNLAHFYNFLGILWIVLVIALSVSFSFGLKTSINLSAYYHHEYLFVIWVIGFLMWWTISWYYLEKWIPDNLFFRYLRFCGKNVTVFYVIQWLLIGNIATEIYRTQTSMQYLVWLLIILVISSLMTYSYTKLKAVLSIKTKL